MDPRDLLRGDYLILNYKISDVPANLFSPPVRKDLPYGTKIFVALAPGTNQFYEVTRASTNEFAPAADEVLLRGKSDLALVERDQFHPRRIRHRKLFTSPKARAIRPANSPRRPSCPRPAIAKIKEVFVDGKPYAEAMKNEAP